ncbi:MAG: SAM-dependent chlorinase/fluorinase [Acidobacteriota bacterium]|nr:SAM-dependent chlorinase/fluorinase [Acidobacteriota bacterium]
MPILTLTTDFGLTDHFVGAMKGVILGICPEAQIVDIGHQVGAYEIAEAGFLIAQAWRYFPARTVHVIVVDPGVGGERRPIVAEAGGHYFVAPDNGVLSMILAEEEHKVRWITAEKYFHHPVSRTFHGRDIFAPIAAHLAAGAPVAKLGKKIDDYLRLSFERPVRTARRGWTGSILWIDRFGNAITNFRSADFPQIETQPFEMRIGLRAVGRLASNYAELNPGELSLIAGSSGYLEVAANQASAAKILGCAVGAPVELRLL